VDLRGRKAADAAFWFAMSGVTNPALFDELCTITANELERFGTRSSCKPKHVLQMVEKLAAAGVRGMAADRVFRVAAHCLSFKGYKDENVIQSMEKGWFGFHTERSLLLLWRFSTRQRKQRSFLQTAAEHWEAGSTNIASLHDVSHEKSSWWNAFDDPTKPLVIDIGCGFGASLLGLADPTSADGDKTVERVDVSHCNFVGADLSRIGIGFGKSVASRWGIDDRLQLVVASAETILEEAIERYPGVVKLVMIQFPTPYRLVANSTSVERSDDDTSVPSDGSPRYNSQLPANKISGFMVTDDLLKLSHEALKSDKTTNTPGCLLVQSNCEDVAVTIRKMAVDTGFEWDANQFVAKYDGSISEQARTPQRTSTWLKMGGEKAEGAGWCSEPILPRQGATETEISCIINGTPIHRCLLIPSQY